MGSGDGRHLDEPPGEHRLMPRVDVVAVTVTYGDRFDAVCRRTVERALAEGVSGLLIVDNGSSDASARAMDEFAGSEPRVSVVRNATNEGSAKAFRAAMIWARETSASLVWLLDDDNAVEPGTLSELLDVREAAIPGHGDSVIVAPRRIPNALHDRVAAGMPLSLVYPRPGAFLGFDVLSLIGRRLGRGRDARSDEVRVVAVPYAPYGGLLVSRELLNEEALPDPRLQLYADDTVWTSQLVRSEHTILLVLDVVITDLEGKWTHAAQGNSLTNALRSPRRDRLYLSTRNRVLYDHRNLDGAGSRLRYALNRAVVMLFATSSAMRNRERESLRVFRDAVRDGERGDLSRVMTL